MNRKRFFFSFAFAVCSILVHAQNFRTINNARQIGYGCYQLNSDSVNTYGCVWSFNKIDLTQAFDKTIIINLGSKDNGADGISFTLHNSIGGLNTYGYVPSFMAYDGISPSLNIEVDTYDNTGNGYPDIAADHVGINKNGSVFNVLSPAIAASGSGKNIEDGKCHRFRIKWAPSTYNITVYFDDTLRINKTYNLVDSIFGGVTQVYWGLTGASGAVSNQQSFCDIFADAGSDTWICPYDSVTLSAALAYSYQWTPTAGLSCPTCRTTKASPTATTNYVLKATSFFGCVAYDTVKVNVYPGPTTNAGPDITLCAGDSIQLNILGAAQVTFNTKKFLSDSAIANPWCKPTSTITYIISGTNSTNCFRDDTLRVIVAPAPVADAGRDTFVCNGGNVQMRASGGAYFQWTPGYGLSATNIANPLAFPTVTTTYKVVVSNGTCKDSDTVVVSVKPTPTTFAGNDFSLCQGDSVKLNATGADTYAWNDKLYLSDTSIANPWVRPLFSHTFIVTGRTTFGCTKNDTLTINVVPKVRVTLGPDTGFCKGGSVLLKATLVGTNKVTWFPNYKINDTTSSTIIVSPDADTTYFAIVNNGYCSDTAKVHVAVWEYPITKAGTDVNICEGDSIQLNGSGSGNVIWIPSTSLSNPNQLNPYAKPLTTTSYILNISSIHGCTSYDTVNVNVTKRYTIDAGLDDTICVGFSKLLVSTTGAPQRLWNTGDTAAAITVKPSYTTTYIVQSLNSGCYGKADSVTIFVDTTLHALFIPTPDNGEIPLDVTFQNQSRGALSTHWDFGDGTSSSDLNPIHTYQNEGNYRALLTVTNQRGCIDTFGYLIVVRYQFKMIIPNVFSPNEDGLNDFFEIFGTGLREFHLALYNRWGQMVFKSDDILKSWNGKLTAEDAPAGAYYYDIIVVNRKGENHQYKGLFTLVR